MSVFTQKPSEPAGEEVCAVFCLERPPFFLFFVSSRVLLLSAGLYACGVHAVVACALCHDDHE